MSVLNNIKKPIEEEIKKFEPYFKDSIKTKVTEITKKFPLYPDLNM